jgi:hypothetical protein
MTKIRTNETTWTIEEQEADYITVASHHYEITNETEKAIEIRIVWTSREVCKSDMDIVSDYQNNDAKRVWVPKSQITISENTIEMPEWIANKNGITGIDDTEEEAIEWASKMGLIEETVETTKTINRSEIMQRAWSIYRESGCSHRAEFSICLKMAWEEAKKNI